MNRPRLLVVDDDQSIRETFVEQLGPAGFDVLTANSAEAAMAGLHETKPHVIITDVRMQGIGGLEFLAWARRTVPDVDVIVITAHEDMQTAMTAIQNGAYEFLVKPLDLDQLEAVIARCIRDRAAGSRAERLAARVADPQALPRLVGRDPQMIALSKTIGALTTARSPVLIRGETGTGKEVVARAIHFNSPSAAEPFVAVNCTAIPEGLLESELFGHVRGAFTGAATERRGRFELAGVGTIFLDEIGDLSPAFQAKLLRVLQDGEFYPVGSEQVRRTRARILAATHRPLEDLVRSGSFREDLYYRLRVVELVIPPLRERRGDVAAIAEALLDRIRTALGKEVVMPVAVLRALERYDWPGNVRELENALTRAAALARGSVIAVEDLSLGTLGSAVLPEPTILTLHAAVRSHAERVLAMSGGSKRKAAKVLDISRQRLDRILADEPDTPRGQDGNETLPESDRD